jgi:hypothetical protein
MSEKESSGCGLRSAYLHILVTPCEFSLPDIRLQYLKLPHGDTVSGTQSEMLQNL